MTLSPTSPAVDARGAAARRRRFALLLIVAASLAACHGVVVGPVSHGCPGNPAKSSDSGCLDSHND